MPAADNEIGWQILGGRAQCGDVSTFEEDSLLLSFYGFSGLHYGQP
jgi:hypothetical protein